jgi:hypothetical protein
MKFLYASITLFSLFAFWSPVCGQQSPHVSMSGVVQDQKSRKPIGGAKISVIGNQANPATTDEAGVFYLELSEGLKQVRIRVEKPGYRTSDKWFPVSSAIPIQISLEPISQEKRTAPAHSVPMESPIVRSDLFSVLVPFHGEWKNSPIPMDSNPAGPHEEFYSDLVGLAGRPDKPTEGWPVYRERKFDLPDEQFHFVTRMLQYYVLRSIYYLERGVSGTKWTVGVGVTPIERKAVIPPDNEAYPTEEILRLLTSSEFLTPMEKFLWDNKHKPLPVPLGTRISLLEHEDPQKGEVFTCTVQFERPGYFKLDFDVRAGMATNDQLPAGFSSQAVKGTTTYNMTVSMRYEIQRGKVQNFRADEYAAWADALFIGLKKQMGFSEEDIDSLPRESLEASFAINATADLFDYSSNFLGAAIPWKPEYAHVLLNFGNNEQDDFSDVDLVIGTDENIAAVVQKTNFPDVVIFSPIADSGIGGSLATVNKEGQKATTPMVAMEMTSAPQYRIRCGRIFSHSTVQLNIALVSFNTTPGVERQFPYAPKSLPKWMDVKGTYKVGQKVFAVERHLEFKPNLSHP